MLKGEGSIPIKIPRALPERLYFAKLRHLIFFRSDYYPAKSMLCTVYHACKAARRLRDLETLDIDFVDVLRVSNEGRHQYAKDPGTKNTQSFVRASSRPANPCSKLQKIRITGLYRDHLTLLLVQGLKNVLSPAGFIGIGFVPEGTRFYQVYGGNYDCHLHLRPRKRMELHWMARDEVADWVSSTQPTLPTDSGRRPWIFLPDRDDFVTESE